MFYNCANSSLVPTLKLNILSEDCYAQVFIFSAHELTSLSCAIAPPLFIQKRSHPDVLQLHKFILSTNPKIKHPKRGLLCTSIYF